MQIFINEQNIKISDRLKNKIIAKFEIGLGRILKDYQEDLQKASLSIERNLRSGYQIKFDMNLPGCPVNVKTESKVLMDGVIDAKNKAKRQVRKSLDKIRGY